MADAAGLSFGRLLLAALLVAPVASCGGALLSVAVGMSRVQSQYSSDTYAFAFAIVAFLSFVAIVPGLLLAGIPLALLTNRLGIPALARDAIFIAAGVLAAWIFARAYPGLPDGLELGLCIGLTTAILWVLAVHIAARNRTANGAAT